VRDVILGRRAAYVASADALVVADAHLGRGEASAVAFPVGGPDDLRDRLAALLDRFGPGEVVFAGDVLHTFDRATDRAQRGLRALTDACRAAAARPVFVAGNHDGLLPSVVEAPVHDAYPLGDGTVVCHGHAAPDASAAAGRDRDQDRNRNRDRDRNGDRDRDRDRDSDSNRNADPDPGPERYVIGHEHPTIAVEGDRHPCFLHGEGCYRGGDLLVLPTFTRLAAGVEVNGMATADFDSPLVGDADALCPIVHDPATEETFEFPPLGEFRRLL
jgi:metallophosphoesterase superfamily enzyme